MYYLFIFKIKLCFIMNILFLEIKKKINKHSDFPGKKKFP